MSRSTAIVFAALAVIVLGGGCGKISQSSGRPDPVPEPLTVSLSPADGRTGFGSDVRVEVAVLVPYEVNATQLVKDIADSLLVLDSSGTPLVGEMNQYMIGYEGTDNTRVVDLLVKNLGPGWHEVEFESAQEFLISGGSIRTLGGGRYVSRFSAESMPSLMSVSVCSKNSRELILEFTEPVRTSGGEIGSAVAITGVDPEMSYECTPLLVNGLPSFDPEAVADKWSLDCGDVQGTFKLSLSGVASESVELQPPTQVLIELSNLPVVDGCATWMRP